MATTARLRTGSAAESPRQASRGADPAGASDSISTTAPAAAGSMAMSASVLVAWCLCSGARMFLNKAVYSTGYRYPFAVTGLSQAFALLCAWALVQARAVAYRPCGSWRQYARTAMPAAAASVATLYTGNVAVMMLPVTFVQIVKGLTPSVTLLLAVLLRQERLSAPLVATVGAISAGSALSCARQGSLPGFSWLGFVFQVRSCGAISNIFYLAFCFLLIAG